VTDQERKFVAEWLIGSTGRSSKSLVAFAITGDRAMALDFPLDAGDLSRCLRARWLAPPSFHGRMDALLGEFKEALGPEKTSAAYAMAAGRRP
jgi:hypothetical protein